MSVRMEHANLAVRDLDGMIRFLQAAFPEFKVRRDVKGSDGSRWVHIGTADNYIALSPASAKQGIPWVPYSGRAGVNHLGYEVDDAEGLRQRLLAAGYKESTPANSHPYRKRVYFHDPEGNDWEFVQYLTSDPAQRNDYELPDR